MTTTTLILASLTVGAFLLALGVAIGHAWAVRTIYRRGMDSDPVVDR